MEILNWVGKLNCDSLLEYECSGNGGLGQLDQMVVIPKDWKFNLSEFQIWRAKVSGDQSLWLLNQSARVAGGA